MSETVDTRVVEAKFDSKQFEKGVDRTVKKLDELKKSLTDTTTGKTVAEIGNKVQDATGKATESLEKLQNRFTSFIGMLKQKLLSGIADEIVGVFFRIKNSFENLVSSLSTAQIGVGMQRYTDILTSVRTLVAAGVNQEKAYTAIERLGEYADQTSYSLDSMVATMSKFKTAGADIDTAARMIEGLSNAAASMGVNAQQAERAYLNLQQAYSKKVMLQNDWISFESLPMVGTQFNQAIIDAAVKVGTLEEDPRKKGTYKTKKKAGTKIKAASGITADNLGANLASRWFTDEVMERVFGNTYYFSEIGIDEVNALKAKEREIRDAVKKEAEDPAKDIKNIDDEVNKRLQEYFDETNKVKIDAKKAEIEERKKTAKLELEAKKGNAKEYAEAKKIYDETIKNLDKELNDFEAENTLTAFAYNAFRAGQEARSFTDVLNTLKDAISRGWAKSFELIFGKLDEAADFFTKLTESQFAEAIYRIGEFRNLVLENWVRVGGRNDMISTLQTIDDLFGSIFQKMGLIEDENAKDVFDQEEYDRLLEEDPTGYAANEYKRWAEAQDPFTKAAQELGERIAHVTANIGLYIMRIKAWFTEIDPKSGKSRIDKISDVFNSIGSIINGAATDASLAIGKIFEIIGKFEPVLSELFSTINKVLEPINTLFNPKKKGTTGETVYNGLSNALDNIGKVVELLVGKNGDGPLVKLVSVIGDVVAFFVDIATSSFSTNIQFFSDAFGLLLEILGIDSAQANNGKSVAKGIADDITSLGDACKNSLKAISDFFSSVIADIRTWLGLSDQTTEGGNVFQNIANWWNTNEALQTIKKSIDDFITKIGDWIQDIPENISKIGIDIGDFFKSIFYKKETKYNGSMLETMWVKKDFTKWIEQTVEDIKNWILGIPGQFSNIPSIFDKLFEGIFYRTEKKTLVLGPNGNKQEIDVKVKTPLKKWLDQAIADAKKFINDIPNKLKKLPSLISEFINGLFYRKEKKTLVLGPNGNTQEIEVMVKTPLKKFLDTIVKSVSNFVKELPMHIHNAFVGIGDFFKMIWDALLGNNSDSETDKAKQKINDTVQDGIDSSLANVSTDTIIDRVKKIGSNIWNSILTIFTGNSNKEFNNNWFAEKVSEGIENIGKWADTAWNNASEFLETLPTKIANIFKEPEKSENPPEGSVGSAINNFIGILGDWITSIPDTLLTFWENAEKEIGALWSKILGWISGSEGSLIPESKLTEAQQKQYDLISRFSTVDAEKYKATKEAEWDERNPIISNLAQFFDHLKNYVINKITNLPEDISAGLSAGAGILQNLLETATGWIYDDLDKNENNLNVTPKGQTEESGLLKNLKSFGETIWSLITTTIPGFISAGFKWVSEHAETWWDGLLGLFDNGEKKAEEESKSFGEKVETAVRNAFQSIKDFFSKPIFSEKEYQNFLDIDKTGYAAKLYKENTLSNPILVFFRRIVDNIGDIIASAGPAIVDGLDSAFQWIGKHLNIATNFITGLNDKGRTLYDIVKGELTEEDKEGLKDENGVISPIWESIKSLGQTIWSLITETIPAFIKSAAVNVWNMIPQIISDITKNNDGKNGNIITQLFSGSFSSSEEDKKEVKDEVIKNAEEMEEEMGQALAGVSKTLSGPTSAFMKRVDNEDGSYYIETYVDNVKKKVELFNKEGKLIEAKEVKETEENVEEAMSGLGGILNSITSAFKDFTNDNFSKTGIMLALVAVILISLNKVIDNMMFLDDVIGWNAKWIGIGALLTAISGITAWCVYLASTGDDAALERVKKVIDYVIGIIKTIGELLVTISKLNLASNVLRLITAIMDFGAARATKAAAKASTKASGDVVIGIGGFLKSLLLVFGISEGMEILSTGVANTLKKLEKALRSLSGSFKSIVEIINDLASMSETIIPATDVFNQLKPLFEDIENMFRLETVFTDIESGNKDTGGAHDLEEYEKEQEKDVKTVTKYYESNLEHFAEVAKIMSRLSTAFSQMKHALTIEEGMTLITSDLQSLFTMTEEMKKFGEFGTTEDFTNFKLALSGLTAALNLYSFGAIEDLDDSFIDSAIELLSKLFGNDKLTELITTFTDTSLPDGITTLESSERMVIFAGALASIAKACVEFDENTGDNLSKFFTTISEIVIPKDSEDKVTTLSDQFAQLGNALGSFAYETSDLTSTNIKVASEALDMLLKLAVGLKDIPSDTLLAQIFTGDKSIESFGLAIAKLGPDLATFFDALENLDSNGKSVAYSKDNLSLALMAIDGMARTIQQIAKTSYGASFSSNFTDALTKAFKALPDLGTEVMKFINQIAAYDTPDKVYDYDFIFNAIEGVNKILTMLNNVPVKLTDFAIKDRMKNLITILFGDRSESDWSSNGIIGTMHEFFARIIQISNKGEYSVDLDTASEIIGAYAEMTKQVVELLVGLGSIDYGDLVAKFYRDDNTFGGNTTTSLTHPLDLLIPVFGTFNMHYGTIEDFMTNMDRFNFSGFDKAMRFFEGLQNLTSALYTFSQINSSTGNIRVYEGLENLFRFNWTQLETVFEEMNETFEKEGLVVNPVITPVLEISEDFETNAQKLRDMIGLTNPELNDGRLTYSFDPGINLDEFKPINYATKFDNLETAIKSLGTDISNMQFAFVVNNSDLVAAIGEPMDEWLNSNSVYIVRANMT